MSDVIHAIAKFVQRMLGSALILIFAPVATGATLDDLDFFTGHWVKKDGGTRVEEIWFPSAGMTKTAMFRWADGDNIVAIELIIVTEDETGIRLRFKHYDEAFNPWEADEPNSYELLEVDANKAVFKRLSKNDRVPEYMIYSRHEETLTFRGTSRPELSSNDGDLVLMMELNNAVDESAANSALHSH